MPDTTPPEDPPVSLKMEDQSILTSVKKLLGITHMDEVFDLDMVMSINSSFARLQQLKVGGDAIFQIEGYDETWGDFSTDNVVAAPARTYIVDKARLFFAPPDHGPTLDAIKSRITENEWLLNVAAERDNYE